MRFLIVILFFAVISIAKTEAYIIEFQAKVKNLRTFNISNSEQFRSYDLEGTFTDNYGNYGKSSVIIISDIKNGKLVRLDATSQNIYSNNEKIYMRSVREKSDIDAGIAYNIVIGASKNLSPSSVPSTPTLAALDCPHPARSAVAPTPHRPPRGWG